MSYQSRTPSVKLAVDTYTFNEMVTVLNTHAKYEIKEDNFSLNAKKLKDKLLTYSLPIIKENGDTYVEVRFFPGEASEMIVHLLEHIDIDGEDFYKILLQNRES